MVFTVHYVQNGQQAYSNFMGKASYRLGPVGELEVLDADNDKKVTFSPHMWQMIEQDVDDPHSPKMTVHR